MAAEQYFRIADSAAASGSEHDARNEAWRDTAYHARKTGAASDLASCNSCHSVIDPLGFALENFDVIGGWRTIDEAGKPIDASGTTASGAKDRRARGIARVAARAAGSIPADRYRKADGVRAGAAARILR